MRLEPNSPLIADASAGRPLARSSDLGDGPRVGVINRIAPACLTPTKTSPVSVEAAGIHKNRGNRAEVDQHHDCSENFVICVSHHGRRTARRTPLYSVRRNHETAVGILGPSFSRPKTPQSDSRAR